MRKYWLLLRSFAAVVMAAAILTVSAHALIIEQAQVTMPLIDVYLIEEGEDLSTLSLDDIKATMDGESLQVVSLERASQPIYYCYMLDISGSMPSGHFAAAKQAILDRCDTLRDGDILTLMTFGNEVTLRLEGGESREEVEAVLNALSPTDMYTRFYDAMAALVDRVKTIDNMRRVAVVISDGIEDASVDMTAGELENMLRLGGVSVSALCIDTSGLDVQAFRDFIHITGGELYLYGPDNAGELLNDLTGRLDEGWHLVLSASENIADGSTRTVSISFGDLAEVTTQVRLDRSLPDNTIPEVTKVKYDIENNCIIVTFSEQMKDAVTPYCYEIYDWRGRTVNVTQSMLSYDPTGPSTVISFDELPPQGVYSVTVRGLTDASAEENQMTTFDGSVELETGFTATEEPMATRDLPAESAPVSQTEPSGGARRDFTPVYLLFGCLLAIAAAVVIVMVIILTNKAKQKAKDEKPKKGRNENVRQTARFMFLNSAGSDKNNKDKNE